MEIRKTTPLHDIRKLSPACSCNSCKHGCTMGSGFLAPGDKKKIADFLSLNETELEEKHLEKAELFHREHFRPKILRNGRPYGKCTFSTADGKCAIHPVKPLQCKVSMGCGELGESLMLWFQENYLVDWKDSKSVDEFNLYLKVGGKKLPE